MVAPSTRDLRCARMAWTPRGGFPAMILGLGLISQGTGFIQLRPIVNLKQCTQPSAGVRSLRLATNNRRLPLKARLSRVGTMATTKVAGDPNGSIADLPQVWSSSVSTKRELVPAINEAAAKALAQLPASASIDLALIHVSSIYGNAERLESVVPELRKAVPGLGAVVGCSTAGVVGMKGRGRAVEIENKACLGLTLATLPGVKVQPFYLNNMDVPDPLDPPADWKRAVRMRDYVESAGAGEEGVGEPIFLLYATPQSIDALQDYISGMDVTFPRSAKIGAIASTVSRAAVCLQTEAVAQVLNKIALDSNELQHSLSRSCVFFREDDKSGTTMEESSYFREGMVGVSLAGDIRVRSFISQGARRVGPTFHADKVEGPVVKSLRVAERGADDEGQDDWVSPALPPLAMIKQVQKQLSAEDSRLVQNDMLLGIAPELVMDTPAELQAISKGAGGRFVVQGILRKSMKDGSITVRSDVVQGTRLQLFVRDRDAAKSEFNSALVAYKRRELMETLTLVSASTDDEGNDESTAATAEDNSKKELEFGDTVGVVDSSISKGVAGAFRAAGALMFPGLDRGRNLWEEDSYQSLLLLKTVPVSLGGFFANGVAGVISEGSRTSLFGSSTAVAVFSPITARRTTVESADSYITDGESVEVDGSAGADGRPGSCDEGDEVFSDDSDDFMVMRRDVNSGRPVLSGPVLYSVAESVAQPRNSLEALVWEKEAEVDRCRDRWPMSLLVSRVKMFNLMEENKPRDVRAALTGGKREGGVAMIAEIKKTAPLVGPMRRGTFNAVAISVALEVAGVAAIAVNTDRKFFGCSYEDLTAVRSAVSVPVMCSDVVVYPYQIYQARLAGADAIKLIAPALPEKDLMYFHKIAAALGMQSIVAVSSVKQMLMALRLPGVEMVSINNRNMATWALDTTRVSRILGDVEVQAELKAKEVTLLVEAGLKTKEDVDAVKAAGISVVVVGEAILKEEDSGKAAEALLAK